MNYEKTKIAIYYRLLGMKFFNATNAFNYAKNFHNGKRKDGSEEFSHQVFIANFAITLPVITDEGKEDKLENVISAIFLHDVVEDFDITIADISNNFGKEVAEIVDNVSKIKEGCKVNEEKYFENIVKCPLSVIVKASDRIHNIQSMIGAFSITKQKDYIEETEKYHIPMLKKARKTFPEYEICFENLKQNLQSRIFLIKEMHKHFDISIKES